MALPSDSGALRAGCQKAKGKGDLEKGNCLITRSGVLQQRAGCKPSGPFLPSPHLGISLEAHPTTTGESSVRVNKELKAGGN